MRRLVKEQLLTFEGKPLFPDRFAHTLDFELSPMERQLYGDVTDYVQNGFNTPPVNIVRENCKVLKFENSEFGNE